MTEKAFAIPAYRDPEEDHKNTPVTHEQQTGMDLRDYFAARVLPSVIDYHGPEQDPETILYRCQKAYEYADAMMEARKTQ